MKPPFAGLARAARVRLFAAATGLALASGAGLAALGAPLASEAAPFGIVSFELAGDLPAAERVLAAWDGEKRLRAGISLGADYLFLVAYALALALACGLAAEGGRGRLAAAGALVAWGQLAAGALDALENLALIELLLGSRAPHWPVLARACAIPKFALVAAGLAGAAAGALVRLRARA